MAKNDKEPRRNKKTLASFTENKPIWVFWIIYIAISGALFGVFYGLVYLMTYRWWIAPILVIAGGITWGTAKYSAMRSSRHSEEKA
jgi:hypothetical protein